MKYFACILTFLVLLSAFSGCEKNKTDISISSGNYYAVGEYEEMLTPYLWIDADKNEFAFSAGLLVSYAETGSFEINSGRLIATSQRRTLAFSIRDDETLVMIGDSGNDFSALSIGSEFVYSKDPR